MKRKFNKTGLIWVAAAVFATNMAFADEAPGKYKEEMDCIQHIMIQGFPFVKDKATKSDDQIVRESLLGDLQYEMKHWDEAKQDLEKQAAAGDLDSKAEIAYHARWVKGQKEIPAALMHRIQPAVRDEKFILSNFTSSIEKSDGSFLLFGSDGNTYHVHASSPGNDLTFKAGNRVYYTSVDDSGFGLNLSSKPDKKTYQKADADLSLSGDTDTFVQYFIQAVVKDALIETIGKAGAAISSYTVDDKELQADLDNVIDPESNAHYDRASLAAAFQACQQSLQNPAEKQTLADALGLLAGGDAAQPSDRKVEQSVIANPGT